jgi:hypothetical protein
MDGELLAVRRQTPGDAADQLDLNCALYLLFALNIVHVNVRDDHGAFLDPLVHIHLLNFH